RENGFGRGFKKVDILVLDEAQILSLKAMEDMVPATNAAPNGLVLMMGTPPRPNDPGEVFTDRRESALSGEDEDVFYVEMGADDNANPNDRAQSARLTHHIRTGLPSRRFCACVSCSAPSSRSCVRGWAFGTRAVLGVKRS